MDKNSHQLMTKDILLVLKKSLKQKRITYKMLGHEIGLSESAIKKLFLGNDCSFNRLNEIALVAGLSLPEIFQIVGQDEIMVKEFSNEEEKYFLKNMDCFKLYWALVYDLLDLNESIEKIGLTKKKAYSFLKKLDQFSIIKWESGDKIVIPKVYYLWRDKGVLVKYLKENWSHLLLEEALNSKNSSTFFTLRFLRVKNDSYKDFISRLNDLISEFELRSKREVLNFGIKNVKKHRVLCATAEGSFIKYS